MPLRPHDPIPSHRAAAAPVSNPSIQTPSLQPRVGAFKSPSPLHPHDRSERPQLQTHDNENDKDDNDRF